MRPPCSSSSSPSNRRSSWWRRCGPAIPVPDAVLALWKDDLTESIELAPLDDAQMSELLTRVLGGPIEGIALRQLWEASQGNVQYLRELVLGGIEAETLVDDGGLWRIVGTIPPSRRLSELVAARLGDVADEARVALEVVAFGEPIGVDVLERLTGKDVVGDLERRGLLAVVSDDRRLEARLAHPIHGDVVRHETPDLRAREVYGLLADELERDGLRGGATRSDSCSGVSTLGGRRMPAFLPRRRSTPCSPTTSRSPVGWPRPRTASSPASTPGTSSPTACTPLVAARTSRRCSPSWSR